MSADQRDLHEWLPFDAATHDLARRTGQRMGWPELLQLALDGHAPLCVFLPPVEVHAPVAGDDWVTVRGSRPRSIEGVWNLTVEGLARQHLHQLVCDNGGVVGPAMRETRTGPLGGLHRERDAVSEHPRAFEEPWPTQAGGTVPLVVKRSQLSHAYPAASWPTVVV